MMALLPLQIAHLPCLQALCILFNLLALTLSWFAVNSSANQSFVPLRRWDWHNNFICSSLSLNVKTQCSNGTCFLVPLIEKKMVLNLMLMGYRRLSSLSILSSNVSSYVHYSEGGRPILIWMLRYSCNSYRAACILVSIFSCVISWTSF